MPKAGSHLSCERSLAYAVTDRRRYLEPRTALLAAVALFALGVGVHLAFAAIGRSPTPITLFAFGPSVAVLAYLRVHPGPEGRRVAGLLLGGVAATAVGFFVVFIAVQQYSYLPDGRSTYELFRFNLDLYVWFVLALTGAYTAAARTAGKRALAILAASPLLQAAVPLTFLLLEQWFAGRTGF